jgi:hypothetical protein
MRARFFIAATLAALLSACATPVPAPPPVVEYAHADCTAAPELAGAVSLTPPRERAEFDVSTVVSDQTPCVGDAASGAPYIVYALPIDYSDKTITVGASVESSRIFAANAVLLDANGAVTRTIGTDQFTYRGGLYSAQFRPHQGETYLLVKADRAIVGNNYNSITLGTGTATGCAPGACFNWSYGTEAHGAATFSYTGTIQIQVFDSVIGAHPNAQQAATH